jgi:imidazolonepropionase-like amidohydrolase
MLHLLISTAVSLSPVPDSFLVHDVKIEVGDGTTITSGAVWVEKGQIKAVGTDLKPPAALFKIDGQGKTITPGLFETQTQLGLFEVDAEDSTVDYQFHGEDLSPAFRAVDGYNPLSIRIPIEREEGATHVIASPNGSLLYGKGFFYTLDQSSKSLINDEIALFGSVDIAANRGQGGARGGVWMKLRNVFADAAYYRKNETRVDRGQTRPLALPTSQLKAIWPILDGQQKLVLTAHRVSDIRSAIAFRDAQKAKGHDVQMIIAGGAEAWKIGKEIASAKIPIILTPSSQMPYSFSMLYARDDSPALLEKAKVKVILSSSTWANNVRRLRQEAGIAVAHGMSRSGAFRAISLSPAEAFSVDDQVGSIQPGKKAHLVLWSGDPLELQTHVERMWIHGQEIRLDDRQRALARRYLEKDPRPEPGPRK